MGVFYPPSIKREDFIRYYAQFFEVLEINSSFYNFPDRSNIKRFLEKTKTLRFAFKVHRLFTHTRSYTQEDVKKFLYSIEPAVREERLIALLFQFPSTFGYSQENLNYLKKLSEDFSGYDRVIEVRSKSFRKREFYSFLEGIGFSVVNTDAPKGDKFLSGPWLGVGSMNYVRVHGKDPQNPYNYLYSLEELKALKRKILRLGDRDTYIFFNNTPGAKAVLNALQLKLLFGIKAEIPKSLEKAFKEKEWE